MEDKKMWVIISEERTTEDKVRYTAYGVRNSSYCIGDLCTDSDEILKLVRVLNAYEVSPVNARDIAEDYLAGGFPECVMSELEITA